MPDKTFGEKIGSYVFTIYLTLLVIPLIFGGLVGFIYYKNTGDLKHLADNTLGLIVAQDTQIYKISSELSNVTLKASYPDKYDADYTGTLQIKMLIYLLLISFTLYYFYKFFNWTFGMRKEEVSRQAISLVLAILLFMVIQVGYYIWIHNVWIYPFKGTITFFSNIKEIFSTGYTLEQVQNIAHIVGNFTKWKLKKKSIKS